MSSSSWLFSGGSLQIHLQRALEDVNHRQQVQDCLNDVVTNIEWAAQCTVEARQKDTQDALSRALTQQATVLAESSLVQKADQDNRTRLADALVRELLYVSRELGELYQLRQDHLELSQNYDALVAKLLQADERIQFMKEGGAAGSGGIGHDDFDEERAIAASLLDKGPPTPLKEQDEAGEMEKETPDSAAGSSDKKEPQTSLENKNINSVENSGVRAKSETTATTVFTSILPPPAAVVEETATGPVPQTTAEAEPSDGGEQQAPPEVSLEAENPAESAPPFAGRNDTKAGPSPAVVMLEQDDEAPPRLETLDAAALMHIFGYLDALDILNTAQINISMYSRVDNLFGLGDGDGYGAEADNSTIATGESVPPVALAHQTPASSIAAPQPTIVEPPPEVPGTSAVPSQTQSGTLAQQVRPTVASLPQTPKQGQAAMATGAVGGGAPPHIQGFEKMFGFLQPRKSLALPLASSANPAPAAITSNRKSPARSSDGGAPMNAAMANSMASKLTDAELNAIIHMTERLRTKEGQLEQLRVERERLLAQLDGLDAVKQFLVAKVRSMEESLRQTEDQQAKVAQQIASDQEVIAFLDGRVQELERFLEASRLETASLQSQWQSYRIQAEQKVTVLTDMLRFERERVQETASEYKTTKKLLIKEVKSCRAQIMALTAENKAVSQENETLKRALLLHPSSPSAPKYPHVRSASAILG